MEHASAAAAPAGVRRSARLLQLASDERLVALVRAGEDSAFTAIYDRHHGPILGFCRHMLGSREEAEDAVQHTFLAAYGDLVASTKTIELRPWLFAIARNRCLSLLRARREHVALELAEPATDGLAAIVERREDLRELLADLARLPEDQRAALLLAELGALDHAGVASVLGCPREKVKALVFQARSSLAASREARATPCEQIRIELATASGGELRRGPLRRHLRACEGCRAFKAEIATQRKLLALALPVVPTAALKAGVLAGAGIGGHGGGAGATAAAATSAGGAAGAAATSGASTSAIGGVLGALASTGVAKIAVSAAIVGTLAGGGVLAVRAEHRRAAHGAVGQHVGTASGRVSGPVAAGGAEGAAGSARQAVAGGSPSGRGGGASPSAGAQARTGGGSSAAGGSPAADHGGGSASRQAPASSSHTGRVPVPRPSHGAGSSGSATGGRHATGGSGGRTAPPASSGPAPAKAPASPPPPSGEAGGSSGHDPAGAPPKAGGNGSGTSQAPAPPRHGG